MSQIKAALSFVLAFVIIIGCGIGAMFGLPLWIWMWSK